MNEKEAIIRALRNLSCELRELDVGYSVPRVPCLTPLEFLRDFVNSNKPVIFTEAIGHWPALTRWNKEYLIGKAGKDPVTVALTPDGRADCPREFPSSIPASPTASPPATDSKEDLYCFAYPYERKTTLSTFFNLLEASRVDASAPVPYMQFQNSSLTTELPQLVADAAPDLPFATEAFGCLPDAVNLWIGGKRTITSWHKDHYENLYAMVSGTKSFRLLPPTDSYRMKRKRFPGATWHLINTTTNTITTPRDEEVRDELGLLEESELENGKFELIFESPATAAAVAQGKIRTDAGPIPIIGEDYIIWSGITPTPLSTSSSSAGAQQRQRQHRQQKEESKNLYDDPTLPEPLVVTLKPGEVLFLPACWWHEVHHGHPPEQQSNEKCNNEIDDINGDDVSDDDDDDVAIAVNFWYDQKYDVKYVCVEAVEELAVAAGLNEDEL